MSLANVRAGIKERLQTIDGLTVLSYEPANVQVPRVALILFRRFSGRNTQGQITTTPWEVTVRLLVRWQDNEGAEEELTTLVDGVPLAIDADPQLGGRITAGLAQVPEAESGFVTFGGTLYRMADITIRAVDKVSFAGAL